MEDFFKQWEAQLKKVYYILLYLNTYPDILNDVNLKLIHPDELLSHQNDWVRLYYKFDGAEKDFFKPYWVSIDNSYEMFIDMSDSNFPIFEAFYDYFDEPYNWEKKILFSNITRLMLAEDRGLDMSQFRFDFIWEKYGKYINIPDEDLPF